MLFLSQVSNNLQINDFSFTQFTGKGAPEILK